MRVIEISSYGAPDVLRLAERPLPIAGAGEILIRVSASGINRPDVLQRTGNYPVPPGVTVTCWFSAGTARLRVGSWWWLR